MSTTSHTSGAHIQQVIERLTYAASKAGSIGLGEYTRVHKKDLATLLEAFAGKSHSADEPTLLDLQSRLDRVRHYLTPEACDKDQLQEAVNLAVEVLAVGKSRGVTPELL
jgi:hypothetical protein